MGGEKNGWMDGWLDGKNRVCIEEWMDGSMRFQGLLDGNLMTYWGVLLANHRILSDDPLEREAQVTWLPRCSTIFCPLPTAFAWVLCQLHWHYQVSLFSRSTGLLNNVVDFAVNLMNRVCVQHTVRVSPPPLGCRARPGRGRYDFPGWTIPSGHLLFWGQFPWGNQLLPAPFTQPGLGRWPGAWHELKSFGPTLEPFAIHVHCQ